MAVVQPGKGRAVIENSGAGLRITIPAAGTFFGTAFLGLWLIVWAFAEVMVSYLMILPAAPEEPDFAKVILFAWLAVWTLGGAWCLAAFLWNIAGKEIIELTSTTLKRRKQIPVFSSSREYAVAGIANLRLAQALAPAWYERRKMTSMSLADGTIAFDYRRSTHRLGTDLDEADAKYVIGEMCRKVPSLCR